MTYNECMWQETEGKLKRRFEFPDFASALAFVNQIAKLAESANHHPDVSFGWGYVEVTLTTHKEGGVTNKDRSLAEQINKLNGASDGN